MTEFTGHVRAMRADAEFFGAEDLLGCGDVPFQIDRCEKYENRKACGKVEKLMFTLVLRDSSGKECSKELWLKPTNRKTVVKLYGPNAKAWKGRWVWLYATEVKSPAGGMTYGVRIREKTDAPTASGDRP